MKYNEAGLSSAKQPKITFGNLNTLTDEELLAILETSDCELDDLESDFNHFESSTQSESKKNLSNKNISLPTTTGKNNTRSSIFMTDANTSALLNQSSIQKC